MQNGKGVWLEKLKAGLYKLPGTVHESLWMKEPTPSLLNGVRVVCCR